jgi:hypothetical protein
MRQTRTGLAQEDSGAALIVAMLFVTVVALVTGALLSMSYASLRTTTAMRDQQASAYNADGAAQAAVNQLRADNFNSVPGQCATAASAITLPNFYPATSTTPSASAYVSCGPDPSNGTGGDATAPNTSPGSAILTLASQASGEDGIQISSNAGDVKVRGGIFSNSTIKVPSGGLVNTYSPSVKTYTIARGLCTPTGSLKPAGVVRCSYGTTPNPRGEDPGTLTPHGASYDPPTAPTTPGTIGTCAAGATYQQLTPGRYASADALTTATGCSKSILWFTPGTYYFDFQGVGSHVWTIDDRYVIGGTPKIPLTSSPSVADMPGACVGPGEAAATTTSGVRFVFGGDSRMAITHHGNPGGQVTICASKSPNGPPIAVYGLKTSVGAPVVKAQSGCVTNTPPATTCPVIYSDQSPKTSLTIQGTTYTPRATISLYLNNSTNQVFRWGLITRSLQVDATGSPDLTADLIDVPDTAADPLPGPSIVYLNVYVCPAQSSCDTSGRLRLRARVQISGTSPRTVTVLSWANLR